MGLKEFLGINEYQWEKSKVEINQAKDLLSKFEISHFDDFLIKYLNEIPKDGSKRKEYVKFVIEHIKNREISFEQLIYYALNNNLVSPSFFETKDNDQYDENQGGKSEAEINQVKNLLSIFEISHFDDFLLKYLNDAPKDGSKRKEYVKFVIEHIEDSEISYEQIKDYTLKNKLVPPRFFEAKDNDQYEKSDFNTIINSIKTNFEPEAISDEEHLESQITIFLKAKFSGRKINRQVRIQSNDILDILIDDKYAIELKVPRTKTDLRNLGAQLEEYQTHYPNICAVIFDADTDDLTQDIIDYSDKYKRDYGITSIVLDGKRRDGANSYSQNQM